MIPEYVDLAVEKNIKIIEELQLNLFFTSFTKSFMPYNDIMNAIKCME